LQLSHKVHWGSRDLRWSSRPRAPPAPRCLRLRSALAAGVIDAALVGGVDSLCLDPLWLSFAAAGVLDALPPFRRGAQRHLHR
jgi:hypothetical protein